MNSEIFHPEKEIEKAYQKWLEKGARSSKLIYVLVGGRAALTHY